MAIPLSINRPLSPFFAGDVVWYHPTSSVEPGRLALYESPEFRTGARAAGRHAQLLVEGGLRISRIIATAGQTLTWKDGKMLIDEKEIDPPWLPPDYASILQNVTVPDGQVLIDPTNVMPGGGFIGPVTGEVHGQPVDIGVNIDPGVWRNAALVSADSIVGLVVFRTWPWSRAGFVH